MRLEKHVKNFQEENEGSFWELILKSDPKYTLIAQFITYLN